jgi:hypothetical protein
LEAFDSSTSDEAALYFRQIVALLYLLHVGCLSVVTCLLGHLSTEVDRAPAPSQHRCIIAEDICVRCLWQVGIAGRACLTYVNGALILDARHQNIIENVDTADCS